MLCKACGTQCSSSVPLLASSTDKQCDLTETVESRSATGLSALTTETRAELQWWIQEASAHNQTLVATQLPDMLIKTDASLVGWGAQHQGCRTGGQ